MTLLRRGAWGTAALLVAAATLAVVSPGSPLGDRAGADSGPTITVNPTTQLSDGSVVTVVIKTTADQPISRAEMQVCRSGVDYQATPGSSIQPSDDFLTGFANCPLQPISTSGSQLVDPGNSVNTASQTPQGSITQYFIGVGTQTWTNRKTGDSETITCDPTNPCDLVVELRINGVWTPHVFPLSYIDSDPVAGCGGPATGILQSGGSDSMQDAWIRWTLDDCHQTTGQGGASRAVFLGEGVALNSFAFHPKKPTADAPLPPYSLDLAYTAAGYDSEVGLLGPPPNDGDTPRAAVAVPIALGSSVIAVAGGGIDANGVKQPYTDLKLTQEEVADLLSGGQNAMAPHLNDIFARNPELNQTMFDTAISAGFEVGAPALADSGAWFMTQHLLANVPGSWKVPNVPSLYGTDAGKPRGADASIALAKPSYSQSLTTLTGRPPLAGAVFKVVSNPNSKGGIWILSDTETAAALGMTNVKIANQAGAFVPVDQASVTAGVQTMRPGSAGLLLPDPAAVDPVGGVTPDPLAFVEYALVPAEPLVDKDCTARTASQALLTSWLDYVTGPGQSQLPAGMYPLTPALQQEAQTKIATVGQSPVTGACAGQVTAPPPLISPAAAGPTSDAGSGGATSGSTGGGSLAGSLVRTSRTPSAATALLYSAAPVVSVGSSGNSSAAPKAKHTSLPGFGGRKGISWVGTLLALIVLVGLSGLAALAGSGGALPTLMRRRHSP